VQILTLGRFEIIKDGKPLRFAGKAQQKPLELLMALIARGSAGVPAATLADDLWPEAEGDAGYRALVTSVQRLRKLLEHPEAILFNEGALSLDPRWVWVDAGAFERWLERTGPALRVADGAELLSACGQILTRYRGPFLNSVEVPWAVARRERLRTRHMSLVRTLGRALETQGHEQESVNFYRKSIEADPSVEIFHQHLIHLLLRQNRISEARAAYEHCRRMFAGLFGKPPSRETEALIRPYL
jgi:DNA-binding SARP family transcriptional activator